MADFGAKEAVFTFGRKLTKIKYFTILIKYHIIMCKIAKSQKDVDYIEGETLEERAILILYLSKDSKGNIDQKYRKLAKRFHPDISYENRIKFQIINEAYKFLKYGIIGKNPLMSNDDLIIEILGCRIKPLINKQKKWKEYEQWRMNQFYGFGVI